jgi:hypothetical protein
MPEVAIYEDALNARRYKLESAAIPVPAFEQPLAREPVPKSREKDRFHPLHWRRLWPTCCLMGYDDEPEAIRKHCRFVE